jgi:leader peptidase (prepilin peptidase)/N-methyltransferase
VKICPINPAATSYTALMELVLALALGLVIGSFLNVCIVRLPHRMSIALPGSHCPHCKKAIAFYDNIPILSFMILRGRCRHCHARIAARYPAVEAITGLISILLFLKFGLSMEWAVYFAFCSALLVLALIDVDHRILPDAITLNGIWVGFIVSIILGQPSAFVVRILGWIGWDLSNPRVIAAIGSAIGIVVGGGLLWFVGEAFYRIRGIEGLGFGDVKMMAMVGAFLGAPLTLFTIMAGSLIGSFIGLALIRFGGKTREYELPFGTFLGFAGIVAVLYGDKLIGLYVNHVMGPL